MTENIKAPDDRIRAAHLARAAAQAARTRADRAALEGARMRGAADRMKDDSLGRSQSTGRAQTEPSSSDNGLDSRQHAPVTSRMSGLDPQCHFSDEPRHLRWALGRSGLTPEGGTVTRAAGAPTPA